MNKIKGEITNTVAWVKGNVIKAVFIFSAIGTIITYSVKAYSIWEGIKSIPTNIEKFEKKTAEIDTSINNINFRLNNTVRGLRAEMVQDQKHALIRKANPGNAFYYIVKEDRILGYQIWYIYRAHYDDDDKRFHYRNELKRELLVPEK